MKKFIYILILMALTASSFTSCTEQEIKPSAQNGGAGVSDKVER